jgi:hypothetical protein
LDNPQETFVEKGSSEATRRALVPNGGVMNLSDDWVAGFVDGEGCFHVSFLKHPEMTTGYQVLPEFTVVQHERDKQILNALKEHFKCGVVRRNHGDRWCFRIRKLESLMVICEFFVKHPLKTKKNVDFRKFRKIILKMMRKDHLERDGMKEIIDIAMTMNTGNRESLLKLKEDCGIK